MITLLELLEDKQFKKFFCLVPPSAISHPPTPPWRLHIQRVSGGPWGKKEFFTYREAFQTFNRFRKEGIHDAAIQSKGVAFKPPQRVVRVTRGGKPVMVQGSNGLLSPKTKTVIWEPKLPEGEEYHFWCCYCRRPTIFRYFRKHRTFSHLPDLDIGRDRRCVICGSSESLVRGY